MTEQPAHSSPPRPKPLGRLMRLYLYVSTTLGVVIIVGLVTLRLLWLPYAIPSSSMQPTLFPGDYVFARIGYFQSHEPQRGDIAVFRYPRDRSIDYIKRIVGLPGDRVQMRAGELYVNGRRVGRDGRELFLDAETGLMFREYVETGTDGHRYRILKSGRHASFDDTPEVLVPPGRYFVLGDNRDNSSDSRDTMVGSVARDDLTDRPVLIYWSSDPARIGLRVQ